MCSQIGYYKGCAVRVEKSDKGEQVFTSHVNSLILKAKTLALLKSKITREIKSSVIQIPVNLKEKDKI